MRLRCKEGPNKIKVKTEHNKRRMRKQNLVYRIRSNIHYFLEMVDGTKMDEFWSPSVDEERPGTWTGSQVHKE